MLMKALRKRNWALRAILAGVLLAAVVLIGKSVAAQGMPPNNPHIFWGTVSSNGSLVPAGIPVEARVYGNSVSTGVVDDSGRFGWTPPLFYVPESAQVVIPEGAPIVFYVKGERAELYVVSTGQTLSSYPYQSGGATNINLSAVISFTVTAVAHAGGTMTPAGAVPVTYLGQRSFTMTPLAGFSIDEVLLDGESILGDVSIDPLTGVGSYTISDVAADHRLDVYFAGRKVFLPLTLRAH